MQEFPACQPMCYPQESHKAPQENTYIQQPSITHFHGQDFFQPGAHLLRIFHLPVRDLGHIF